jgi:hypothetical protein
MKRRIAANLILLFFVPVLVAESNINSPDSDTISVIGVGDIMLGTDYPSSIYLPPGNDCSVLLKDVNHLLHDADITFGNLEGTFAGSKGKPKPCKDTTMCFVFRMPEDYVNCLKDAGFDLLSISNNHSNDFGTGGRENTQKVLDSAGIAYAGSYSAPYIILEKDSLRFGFTAFSPFRGCYSIKDTIRAREILEEMNEKCDIIIVSVHGGAEGADHQHVTRDSEIYLGYDRGNIYEFAHLAIDAGADIIFGHGPHVTRAMEVYRGRFIIYSLGNFCTYGRFNLRGPNGIAPIMKVFVSPDGSFLSGKVIPVMQTGRGGVKPDTEGQVIKKVQELNASDFPEIPLTIGEDGNVILVHE